MNGQVYSFGVSGKLWANGLIMYDHQTDSLWSHVAGQAITGLMQGTELRMLPATCTDWGTWKGLHPQTLVLDPLKSPHRRDYSVDPYEGYYSSHRSCATPSGNMRGSRPRVSVIRTPIRRHVFNAISLSVVRISSLHSPNSSRPPDDGSCLPLA
jgi:Protein of unknown function (DUF3179)